MKLKKNITGKAVKAKTPSITMVSPKTKRLPASAYAKNVATLLPIQLNILRPTVQRMQTIQKIEVFNKRFLLLQIFISYHHKNGTMFSRFVIWDLSYSTNATIDIQINDRKAKNLDNFYDLLLIASERG
uniref:Uncharacterized protein n=1 Tax=Glossina austeni TaxID=7395 RepID=A0A1A9VTB6_GLOAU